MIFQINCKKLNLQQFNLWEVTSRLRRKVVMLWETD
ncbi:DUF645 family protein [Staphylococcus sp. SS87]|nr:DUF645 family protein [Staphylococcus singaporensis]MBE5663965.1 DUF645 family protein [Staphylococcus singaporensis]MBE5673586.1 DUF645 family protein [Staphylococcus singaporensis]MBE5675446.1 DUF645 family protein [Staphylococcus singaporensis]